jgi:hypothetical protein
MSCQGHCLDDGPFDDDVVDGPAVTPDGRVVELDGDCAVYFSSSKELSSSHFSKAVAKEHFRMLQTLQVTEEGDAAACSVDPEGIVHGCIPPPSPDEKAARGAQLKLFHRKRLSRQTTPSDEALPVDKEGCLQSPSKHLDADIDALPGLFDRQLSIDSDGIAHHELPRTPGKADRLKSFHRKRKSRIQSKGSAETVDSVASIDQHGIIHNMWQPFHEPLITPMTILAC